MTKNDDITRIIRFCNGAQRARDEIVSMLTGVSNPRRNDLDAKDARAGHRASALLDQLADDGALQRQDGEDGDIWSDLFVPPKASTLSLAGAAHQREEERNDALGGAETSSSEAAVLGPMGFRDGHLIAIFDRTSVTSVAMRTHLLAFDGDERGPVWTLARVVEIVAECPGSRAHVFSAEGRLLALVDRHGVHSLLPST